MTLHNFLLSDYEEVVQMYHDFTAEVYPDRKIGQMYFYYKSVIEWIATKKDIVIVKKDDTIVGFTMSYVDANGGLTEPLYQGVIAYVKPDYRNTRAAYLIYKNVSDVANEKKLTLVSSCLVSNGVSDMVQKHFQCEEMFISLERKV